MATTPKALRYPALRERNFVLIWSGLLVSNMGTWMQNVAQNWLIYQLTGRNPIFLGLLGLSFALPMIVVPPIGGVVVDRVDRIRLLYITQTCSLLLAVLLAVLTWADVVQPWHILVTSFTGALLLAFDNPARQALIPELVRKEVVQNAVSLNSATYTGAALVGPAIAGLLLDWAGAGVLFMINALSYLAVIGALYAMHDPPRGHRTPTPWREAIMSGFRYAWQHKLIFVLLVLSALSGLFGRSYQQLLPVFADNVWRTGSAGYGALLSAAGGGALIGAFAMASAREIRSQGRLMIVSGLIFCAALAAFALTPIFWIGVALLVIVGISSTVFTTMIATAIQLRVPGQLRGRVISLYTITLIGLPSLGALGVASIARSLGAEQRAGWVDVLIAPLHLLGVTRLTQRLGPAAGAPDAIVLCVLFLALAILLSVPLLLRIRAADAQAATRST